MCGLSTVRGVDSSGWSTGSGSTSKTSSPTPAMVPACRASTRASWSTIGPREVLIEIAVRRRCGVARPIRSGPGCRRSAARARVTMSLRSSSSSSSTRVAWCSAARSAVRCGLHATTSHAERLGDGRDLAAQLAQPDDAQRRAGQVQRDELLPLAGPGPAVFAAGVTDDREDQRPGQFDGRGGNEARCR